MHNCRDQGNNGWPLDNNGNFFRCHLTPSRVTWNKAPTNFTQMDSVAFQCWIFSYEEIYTKWFSNWPSISVTNRNPAPNNTKSQWPIGSQLQIYFGAFLQIKQMPCIYYNLEYMVNRIIKRLIPIDLNTKTGQLTSVPINTWLNNKILQWIASANSNPQS